jgi:hypothetical protein
VPVLLDDQGNEIDGNPAEGNLAIKAPWPSMMRSVYGDHKRFYETYFAMFKGYYFTGDGARRDEDGPKSSRHWCCMRRWPKPPWSATRTSLPGRAYTPMSR